MSGVMEGRDPDPDLIFSTQGKSQLCKILQAFIDDPAKLEDARKRFLIWPPRFKRSPPPLPLDFPSPSSPHRKRQERRQDRLFWGRWHCKPLWQFNHQCGIEAQRRTGFEFATTWEEDYELVKRRWVEQGIWRSEWKILPTHMSEFWKHEKPFDPDYETDPDSETQPIPRDIEGDREKRKPTSKRRARRWREHEASRPYHQFIYQLSTERERIEDESRRAAIDIPANINTIAYENIRKDWIMYGIWNSKWGIVPGMSWMHEEPEQQASDSSTPEEERKWYFDLAQLVSLPTSGVSYTPQYINMFDKLPSPETPASPQPLSDPQNISPPDPAQPGAGGGGAAELPEPASPRPRRSMRLQHAMQLTTAKSINEIPAAADHHPGTIPQARLRREAEANLKLSSLAKQQPKAKRRLSRKMAQEKEGQEEDEGSITTFAF